MGTWDIGHFDNDTAADFGHNVDDAPSQKRADVLSDALRRTIATTGFLDSDEGAEAVAAAALIAAQCPGGEPITTAYGPKEPLPPLPVELRPLAVEALDRVLGEESELLELWAESGEADAWRAGIDQLRATLTTTG
ncbi:DUF4259 domain-containing protein [Streptomyces albipurpureus]|uniref:DUF4259 domain-containing protein n=1 Tax=Streptomyces albipurpureus TaxID=2897419 RepID=A0ABT0UQF6_9ACTN|nr:DUF4259 domain-containing protein [Streptomyces sp. CWNU-1]MCM2390234.1 DUF4259 domain-containing protein [Streptomyces sp. CWNU-1]